ncbi:MAG: recombinase family protein [Magnetococcales bacterium]|nr:recombinase family protein [Magnetococcales bacterium]
MAKYGYACISTLEQDVSTQTEALKSAGCGIIRTESRRVSGSGEREELNILIESLRGGDVLVVTRIDRLARSLGALQTIVQRLTEKGATLQTTEQPIDTAHADSTAFLEMLRLFAEFEEHHRRERETEEGVQEQSEERDTQQKPKVDPLEIKRLREAGVGPTAIAKQLGISRPAVYRVFKQINAGQIIDTPETATDGHVAIQRLPGKRHRKG